MWLMAECFWGGGVGIARKKIIKTGIHHAKRKKQFGLEKSEGITAGLIFGGFCEFRLCSEYSNSRKRLPVLSGRSEASFGPSSSPPLNFVHSRYLRMQAWIPWGKEGKWVGVRAVGASIVSVPGTPPRELGRLRVPFGEARAHRRRG